MFPKHDQNEQRVREIETIDLEAVRGGIKAPRPMGPPIPPDDMDPSKHVL